MRITEHSPKQHPDLSMQSPKVSISTAPRCLTCPRKIVSFVALFSLLLCSGDGQLRPGLMVLTGNGAEKTHPELFPCGRSQETL